MANLSLPERYPISSEPNSRLNSTWKKPSFLSPNLATPVVLGIPWLRHHDARNQFARNTITFVSATINAVATQDHDSIPENPPHPPFALDGEDALLQLREEEGFQISATTR